jgi:HlyD family secretion protein
MTHPARLVEIASGLAAIALTAVALVVPGCHRRHTGGDEFGEVTRADIEQVVSSTGQMEPVGTVDVGTQVSGTVAQVLVDFNSRVAAGQLLAVLDTSSLAAQVRDAEAGLARATAEHDQAQNSYRRTQQLYDKGLSSDSDLEAARVTAAGAGASWLSAKAALERARLNLGYAFVRSPINGTVIDRSVEPGQTVAASLSAPTLFVVAQDLSRMRILAQVDESDIGSIDSGLPVKFTVQAYPDIEFTGSATQVRLQPSTSSSVVTYTVVVGAANEGNRLLPGMTATVDFYVQQRQNVLTVPNAALQYQPSQEVMARLGRSGAGPRPDSSAPGSQPALPSGIGMASQPAESNDVSCIWCVDSKGLPQPVFVRTGATDGSRTEVAPLLGEVKEGTKVYTKAAASATKTTKNTEPGPVGPPGGVFGGPGMPPGR